MQIFFVSFTVTFASEYARNEKISIFCHYIEHKVAETLKYLISLILKSICL